MRGELREHTLPQRRSITQTAIALAQLRIYRPSLRPVITRRDTFHKVVSSGRTWVLTFRGPCADHWHEYLPSEGRMVQLTHGRVEVQS